MIIIITQQLVSRTCSSMMELIILVTLRAISASTQQPVFWFGFSTLRHASPLAVRVMRAHGTEIETTPSPPSGPESSDCESVYPEGTMVSFKHHAAGARSSVASGVRFECSVRCASQRVHSTEASRSHVEEMVSFGPAFYVVDGSSSPFWFQLLPSIM